MPCLIHIHWTAALGVLCALRFAELRTDNSELSTDLLSQRATHNSLLATLNSQRNSKLATHCTLHVGTVVAVSWAALLVWAVAGGLAGRLLFIPAGRGELVLTVSVGVFLVLMLGRWIGGVGRSLFSAREFGKLLLDAAGRPK